MATKKDYKNWETATGNKIIKIWKYRLLIILSLLHFIILGVVLVASQTNALSFNLPNIFKVELMITPENLEIIKSYVAEFIANQTG